MLEITNDPETLVAFLDEVQILAPAEQGGGIAPGTPGNLAKGKSYSHGDKRLDQRGQELRRSHRPQTHRRRDSHR